MKHGLKPQELALGLESTRPVSVTESFCAVAFHGQKLSQTEYGWAATGKETERTTSPQLLNSI